jgi:hypothetical protein
MGDTPSRKSRSNSIVFIVTKTAPRFARDFVGMERSPICFVFPHARLFVFWTRYSFLPGNEEI